MKQWIALLLCVCLSVTGAFAVSADSTTATMEGDVTQTEIITNTTIYYEEVEVEVLEKVQSPYPDGTALACIIVGGLFVVLAIVLLCIYLFAFPRWGLVKTPKAEDVAEEAAVTEENTDEQVTDEAEAPSTVSLEDLF